MQTPATKNTDKIRIRKLKMAIMMLCLLSWPVFGLVLFSDSDSLIIFFPALIFVISFILAKLCSKRVYYFISLVNPVPILLMYHIFRPTIAYLNDRPFIMECSYGEYVEYGNCGFKSGEMVYVRFSDDDCDFTGEDLYTADVNNLTTRALLAVFGNPIKAIPDDLEAGQVFDEYY